MVLAFLTKTFQISAEKMIDIEKKEVIKILSISSFVKKLPLRKKKVNYRNEVTI